MDWYITYLIIGTIWCFITDYFFTDMELSNGARIRFVLLWPITLSFFIIGFIENIINNGDEEM